MQNHSAKNFIFSKGLVYNRYFETFRNMSTMTFDEFNLFKQKNPKVYLQPMISYGLTNVKQEYDSDVFLLAMLLIL
uniref:Uncharacterized protein n=1 Tax=Candidatus Phytoplasma australasiaticum subsp. australasiaticum TaxID=2832407 RepID=A0A7S7FZN8_9MOLU|nr:hypothetical protein H7685_01625 ['Parthenium hysterophorus' phyllody phytoplasma]